jgi:hypothetical protein
MKTVTPKGDEATARALVDLLREKRFEEIEQQLDPSIVRPDIGYTFAKMAGIFPAGEPISSKVVGVTRYSNQDSSETNLTLEYEFPGKWLLVYVRIRRQEDESKILAFQVKSIPDSLENINKFTLTHKGHWQYFVLALAVVAFSLSLYAFVLCLRNEKGRLKWLWAVFVLTGIVRFGVNWTTGETVLTPLAIHLPCASATAVPYGPWLVAVFVPLGAILYLVRMERMRSLPQSSAPASGTSPASPGPPSLRS